MVSVVIPCYKVKKHILEVLRGIGSEIDKIYVVDDCCPEESGRLVEQENSDPRVQVLYHSKNQGVGGAVITGYKKALEDGCKVAVKIDGDGQMDTSLLGDFIHPILDGEVDYTKGNRFFFIEGLRQMPRLRLFGNAGLSFINKVVSGYWNVMDPTNGFTAIHLETVALLPLEKIAKRYFFESDMLFRLNTIRAVVRDIPMPAKYEDEVSNLSVKNVLFTFPPKYLIRFIKRIFYNYFLRDFNIGSISLVAGTFLTLFGVVFGSVKWVDSWLYHTPASTGTVMLATLPVILGFQTLLFFLQQDISAVPTKIIRRSKSKRN